ncbi:UNVERIFIED_CONTAM: hypothetical protein FKN15_016750 [Acipenser sinensis]
MQDVASPHTSVTGDAGRGLSTHQRHRRRRTWPVHTPASQEAQDVASPHTSVTGGAGRGQSTHQRHRRRRTWPVHTPASQEAQDVASPHTSVTGVAGRGQSTHQRHRRRRTWPVHTPASQEAQDVASPHTSVTGDAFRASALNSHPKSPRLSLGSPSRAPRLAASDPLFGTTAAILARLHLRLLGARHCAKRLCTSFLLGTSSLRGITNIFVTDHLQASVLQKEMAVLLCKRAISLVDPTSH